MQHDVLDGCMYRAYQCMTNLSSVHNVLLIAPSHQNLSCVPRVPHSVGLHAICKSTVPLQGVLLGVNLLGGKLWELVFNPILCFLGLMLTSPRMRAEAKPIMIAAATKNALNCILANWCDDLIINKVDTDSESTEWCVWRMLKVEGLRVYLYIYRQV
jgi:hypothetical protein